MRSLEEIIGLMKSYGNVVHQKTMRNKELSSLVVSTIPFITIPKAKSSIFSILFMKHILTHILKTHIQRSMRRADNLNPRIYPLLNLVVIQVICGKETHHQKEGTGLFLTRIWKNFRLKIEFIILNQVNHT